MKNLFPLYNWHLEISSKCALQCPHCLRTLEPNSFKPRDLDTEFIKSVFSPNLLRGHVLRITFSGGLGDAIYNKNLIEMVRYLKTTHPHYQQVIVTNGSHKSEVWWKELCGLLNENDEIIFSIDGWDNESNNLYRVNSDWDSIMVGMNQATKSRALTRWSTIVFRFNQDKIEYIQQLAEKSKVDSFHYVFSDRFLSPEGTRLGDHALLQPDAQYMAKILKNQRHKIKFPANNDKIKKSKTIIKAIDRAFEERKNQSLEKYKNHLIMPTCTFAHRGNYIDADGYYYPCSWIGHIYPEQESCLIEGKKQTFPQSFGQYKERLNLHERSLRDILTDPLWTEFAERWDSKENAPITCEQKCLNQKKYLDAMDVKLIERE